MGTDQNKAAKKAAKAQVKAEKKRTQLVAPPGEAQQGPVTAPPTPSSGADVGAPSPQERSARAAERRGRLQRAGGLAAVGTRLIAVCAGLLAARPWRWLGE